MIFNNVWKKIWNTKFKIGVSLYVLALLAGGICSVHRGVEAADVRASFYKIDFFFLLPRSNPTAFPDASQLPAVKTLPSDETGFLEGLTAGVSRSSAMSLFISHSPAYAYALPF